MYTVRYHLSDAGLYEKPSACTYYCAKVTEKRTRLQRDAHESGVFNGGSICGTSSIVILFIYLFIYTVLYFRGLAYGIVSLVSSTRFSVRKLFFLVQNSSFNFQL